MSAIAGLFQRLLANSVESETYSYDGTPCWEWTGRIRRCYPYVTIRVPGKKNPQGFRAHRVMAEIAVGRALHPILETIEHACELPWCINYMHFKLATSSENRRDGIARRYGRPRLVLQPLIDPARWDVDRLMRSLPVLKSTITDECPF